MIKKTTSEELQSALEEHLSVTEEHVARCEQTFEMMGKAARARKCEAMEGLIKRSRRYHEKY